MNGKVDLELKVGCISAKSLQVVLAPKFGFMKCKGTTDTIFIVRQMQKKFTAKGKKLYFGFVDLEKTLIGLQEK